MVGQMAGEALKAAQIELARRELAKRQAKPEGLGAAMSLGPVRKEGQTVGQALYENIVGQGEVDTLGEQIGDVIGAAAAGGYRGIKGLLETPEMLVRLGTRAGEEIRQFAGIRDPQEEKTAVLDTATGRLIEGAYGKIGVDKDYLSRRGETTAAQYAGTIGEFLPAAIGGGASAARYATMAGIGSEAAGQATEGTPLEPIARVVGAIAAPTAITGIKNKTVQALTKKSAQMPAVETARNAKNAAYKAFDAAGGQINKNMDDVIRDIELAVDADDMFISYVPTAAGSEYVDAARKALIKHSGKDMNLAQLDKIRAGLGDLYKRSGFDSRVAFIRDKIDDVIDSAPATAAGDAGDLLKVARLENRKYRKIEAFDEMMQKAELGAASTGSGGNLVNKYRQAVASILNSKSKRAKFDKDELEMMRNFVEGSMSENTLRLISKLAPNGNGLMAALNVAAIASNPAFVAGTIAGMGAKSAAEAKALGGVDAIRDLIISGVPKDQRKFFTDNNIRVLLGLQANEGQ
jgi:hypothetical protein